MSSQRIKPHDRSAFDVAIICALGTESDAVETLFDQFWEGGGDYPYEKVAGDTNSYTLGRIGQHNVVLAYLPGIGTIASSSVAASFRASFPSIRLALVVGICGAVPRHDETKSEILLGDVIVSTGVVQFDFGRQFSDQLIRRDASQGNLGMLTHEIRAFLNQIQGRWARTELRNCMSEYLGEILHKEGFERWKHPGITQDKLYAASYRHKHQVKGVCTTCTQCISDEDPVCTSALELTCVQVGCDYSQLVPRDRIQQMQRNLNAMEGPELFLGPTVHFGLIASGNVVMKSASHRDRIAAKEKVIGFEMEGAGVWDKFPTVIIKGVCDYADSHKNKTWQNYAAMAAAACSKAFLQQWRAVERTSIGTYFNENMQSRNRLCLRQAGLKFHDKHREYKALRAFKDHEYKATKSKKLERAEGTCQWFLEHEEYLKWQESAQSCLLWYSGDPGCGKSVMSRHLVDTELRNSPSDLTFFFFDSDAQQHSTMESALRAILHQLFSIKRHLLHRAVDLFECNGTRAAQEPSLLWELLQDCISDDSVSTFICVLDGLDECKQQEIGPLIKRLVQLLAFGDQRRKLVKIFITSRPYFEVVKEFRRYAHHRHLFHIAAENENASLSNDVQLYVRQRLDNLSLSNLSPKQICVVKGKLKLAHQHNFLCAFLLTESLFEQPPGTMKQLLAVLDQLPISIEEQYERILSRCTKHREAKEILSMVIAAQRPLSLEEIDVILAFQGNGRSFQDLDL